jgi:RNA polymerase sigma factor (sigma-70 family)
MTVAVQNTEWLLDSQPDQQLVDLARAGHESAFAEIVKRYRPELQAQARRLTSDGRAEDVVQQAFLNAFTALQSGSDVRHLRGWLHQILRNVAAKGHVPAEAPLHDASAHGEPLEELVERRATARATLTEISALPERQRDALVDTAVHGFPRAQVATTMGLSEGAVRQLVHRARLTLRQAATALLPLPAARWLGGLRGGAEASPEVAIGAGTVGAGGLAVKMGALIASGALATGIAVTHVSGGGHSRPTRANAAKHHAGPAHHRTLTLALNRTAAVAGPGLPVAGAVTASGPAHAGGAAAGRQSGARSSLGNRLNGGSDHGRDGGQRGSSGQRGTTGNTAPRTGGGDGARRGAGGTSSGGGGHSGTGDTSGNGGSAGDHGGGSSGASGSSGSGHGDSGSGGGSGSGSGSGSGGHDGAAAGTLSATTDASSSSGSSGSDSASTAPAAGAVSGSPGTTVSGSGSGDGGGSGLSGQGQDSAIGASGSGTQTSSGSRDLSGSGDSSSP